jgi:hypothetical protein
VSETAREKEDIDMRPKLRIASVSLLVAVAAVAATAFNASAKTGGHFVSEATHTIVNQTSSVSSLHQIEFVGHGLEGAIICDQMTATGTISTQTVTEALGNIFVSKCHTTGSEVQTAVHINGCQTRITVASGDPATTEQTNDIVCPAGKAIEITHPNCTIKIAPQVVTGLTYKTTLVNGKHSITVEANAGVTTHYEAGICIFTGTTHTGTFTGSTIVRPENTVGESVGVTAT